MLCYAMLCYAMLCYAVLCCALLCCAVLRHAPRRARAAQHGREAAASGKRRIFSAAPLPFFIVPLAAADGGALLFGEAVPLTRVLAVRRPGRALPAARAARVEHLHARVVLLLAVRDAHERWPAADDRLRRHVPAT